MRPLAGRVAVVTGASRGMGRSIVLRLAEDGAHCVILYRQAAAEAREVARQVEATGSRALALAVDLREPARVGPLFERIAEAFGRVDILVANAAATAFKPILEQKEHNLRRTFAITVDAFVAAVQAAVPLMAGRPGRIVAISGIDSHQAMAGHGVLGAAKSALESLVRALALELGPLGITANAVSPGFIETDSSRIYTDRGLKREYSPVALELIEATPVRRLGTGEDVAALVAYLVSDAAGFLTGQTILLDGGLTIVSPLHRPADDLSSR
jgi:enoyl-[acyl-carrier protein] reductase III